MNVASEQSVVSHSEHTLPFASIYPGVLSHGTVVGDCVVAGPQSVMPSFIRNGVAVT